MRHFRGTSRRLERGMETHSSWNKKTRIKDHSRIGKMGLKEGQDR